MEEKEKKKLTAKNKWMRKLTPNGVDNISVKDVFKVCFEEATNDSSAQWLKFRHTGFLGYYL